MGTNSRQLDRLTSAFLYFVADVISTSGRASEGHQAKPRFLAVAAVGAKSMEREVYLRLLLDLCLVPPESPPRLARIVSPSVDAWWKVTEFLDTRTGLLSAEGRDYFRTQCEPLLASVFSDARMARLRRSLEGLTESLNESLADDLDNFAKDVIRADRSTGGEDVANTYRLYAKEGRARAARFGILHLSDLHITASASQKESHLAKIGAIARAVDRSMKEVGSAEIDCVVVSGDGIDRGADWNKYIILKAFLEECSRKFFGLERPTYNKVVYAPGNHDIDRSVPVAPGQDEARTRQLHVCMSMIEDVYGKDQASLLRKSNWNQPLIYSPAKPVAGLALRSPLNIGHLDFGYVQLGAEFALAVDSIDEAEGPQSADRLFRFATWHHHVVPVANYWEADIAELEKWGADPKSGARPPDMSITANGRWAVDRLFDKDFRLLLLGHAHQPFVRTLERTDGKRMCIVGCGTLGAPNDEMPHDYKFHGFNFVTLDPVLEEVRIRRFQRNCLDTVGDFRLESLDEAGPGVKEVIVSVAQRAR